MKPPYFAVIFSSTLRNLEDETYRKLAVRMEELAKKEPGFLEMESFRRADGKGVTISYWKSLADIKRWKNHAEHLVAQEYGKQYAYSNYTLRICEVQKAYSQEGLKG